MRFLEGLVKAKGCVGVEFSDKGISVAVKKYTDHAISEIKHFDIEALGKVKVSALQRYVQSYALKNYDCNIVLSSNDYQLLLVEAPEVSNDELREAIKWKVKELLTDPVETKVLDVFLLPEDANKTDKKFLYVVVCDRKRIETLVNDIKGTGLVLRAIDIEVMALRNLALLKDKQKCVAVVRVKENSGEVSIFREGNLYLTRSFHLDYGAGFLDELPTDALALEIQRSFDYFERQMHQAPPSLIFLCGDSLGAEKISDHLRTALPARAELLDVQEILIDPKRNDSGQHPEDNSTSQLCLGAIGATLRAGVV